MPDKATASALSALRALQAISKIEAQLARIYRFFHAHLCYAFTPRMTPEQALLVLRLPPEGCPVGHLTLTGAYAGSNSSHNIKKLVQGGYINYAEHEHDRRSRIVRRTEQGERVLDYFRRLLTFDQ